MLVQDTAKSRSRWLLLDGKSALQHLVAACVDSRWVSKASFRLKQLRLHPALLSTLLTAPDTGFEVEAAQRVTVPDAPATPEALVAPA